MTACKGCGKVFDLDIMPPSHCDWCPPWLCEHCGETDSSANPCSCWTSLEGMAPADVKALFAECDQELSIDSIGAKDGRAS
jgi:hypothetical protein